MGYPEVFWSIHKSIGKPSIFTSKETRTHLDFYHLRLKSGIASLQFMDRPSHGRMEMMLAYCRGFHPTANVMQALTLRPPTPSNMQNPAYVRAFAAPHYMLNAHPLNPETREADAHTINNGHSYELADDDDADMDSDPQCDYRETTQTVKWVFDSFIANLCEQNTQITNVSHSLQPALVPHRLSFVSDYGDAVCVGNTVEWYTTMKGRVRLLVRFSYDEVQPLSEAEFRAFVTALLLQPEY